MTTSNSALAKVRWEAKNCPKCVDCGKQTRKKTASRCKDCNLIYQRGANHHRWRGGTTIDSNGYVLVFRPEHPRAQGRGYIMEHRVVVEEHLRRELEDYEVVHHIDGNKENNSIDNLMLFFSDNAHKSYHAGNDLGRGDILFDGRNQN